MQIPRFWAQARLRQESSPTHGITIQRWGWSDDSQLAAEAHARQRAQAALDDTLAAPKQRHLDSSFRRMEPLGEYGLNGGTPIREEILQQRGDTVLTRNSYGAHCLNTPHVAIADVDYPLPPPVQGLRQVITVLIVAFGWFVIAGSQGWNTVAWISMAGAALVILRLLKRWQAARQANARRADPRVAAMERIVAFSADKPGWGLRLYQTPKGMRVIVTHQALAPDTSEVQTLFDALQVDPLYARLCQQQQCFRARVTAKPWRMGMNGPSPQSGRWPVADKHLPQRQTWNAQYDTTAVDYSACQFISQLGQQHIDMAIQPFVDWHDAACRAHDNSLRLA